MWLHVVDPSPSWLMTGFQLLNCKISCEGCEATLELGVRNPLTRVHQCRPSYEKLCGLSDCVELWML